MNKIAKKTMIITLMAIMLISPAMTIFQVNAAIPPPYWDATGNYKINVEYLGEDYLEDLVLTQINGDITSGSIALVEPAGGSPWTLDTGFVSGDTIEFGGFFNSNPGLRILCTGTIAFDGSMSGDWADVLGGSREGTWATTSGNAQPIIITLTLSDGSPLAASIQILTEDDLPDCIPALPLGVAGEFTPYIDVTILENFDGTVTVKVYYCLLYTSPSPRDRS